MKIDGKNPFISLDAYIKNSKDDNKVSTPAGKGTDSATKADEVVLSPMAKEIGAAKKMLETTPDVREEKVALIREQIKNGTYEVDGDKIAGKMLMDSILKDLV